MSERPITFHQFYRLQRCVFARMPGMTALLRNYWNGQPPMTSCDDLVSFIGFKGGYLLWHRYERFCDELSKQRG